MPQERDGSWLIRGGLASCGIAAGGRKVYDAFDTQLRASVPQAKLKQTGCMGICYNEVLVEVVSPRNERTFYGKVTPDRVPRIIDEHLVQGKPIDEWVIPAAEMESLLKSRRGLCSVTAA